jgi:YidC/Oxa1 family membrane protein insertase
MAMEMMALYRNHKVNPMSGCWPVLIQIPIFFAFYKVILIAFEFRQAPFVGWIVDLSVKDPFYVLPILMGITMIVQQRLNPPAMDPIQQRVLQFLPVLFTVMFLMFPAGLVLYWFTNNLLSIAQQWWIMRRMGVKA